MMTQGTRKEMFGFERYEMCIPNLEDEFEDFVSKLTVAEIIGNEPVMAKIEGIRAILGEEWLVASCGVN